MPIKTSSCLFRGKNGQVDCKIPTEIQRTQNSQNNLGKEEQAGELTFSDVKTYYITMVIKTAWNWHKDT